MKWFVGAVGPGARRRRFPLVLLLAAVLPASVFGQAPVASSRDFAGRRSAAERAVLSKIEERMESKRLWESATWRRLLHYKPGRFVSSVTSEADGPGFFLAPDGKTNPRAEMAATLAAFFSAEALDPGGLTPQCTFPARSAWLRAELEITPTELPIQACERFERWRARVDPESVSLVFASHYLNNPASMFGHTLLRFNKKGRGESERLLDYALNYAAAVDLSQEGGLTFAVKGLFGGYVGQFSAMPYYLKVNEYNDFESRDLWEYELSLSERQVLFMLMHAWELETTTFDYYFLDENCSYHLLSLIEIARPDLDLTGAFSYWTIPTDTVRVLTRQPGLVRRVTYRPSSSSRVAQRLSALSPTERALVAALTEGRLGAGAPEFQELAIDRRALTFDAAAEFLQFRLTGSRQAPEDDRMRLRAVLIARSRLGSPNPTQTFAPLSTPPEQGHGTARVAVALGRTGGAAEFAEISLLPGVHDLLSREEGYAANSQIRIAEVRLRYEVDSTRLRLERLALLDIVSLSPLRDWVRQLSWKARLGWERNRDIGCAACTPFVAAGGIGLSMETRAPMRLTAFAMADVDLEFDAAFAQDHRAGLGASLGVLVEPMRAWRIALTGGYTDFRAGQRGIVRRAALQQRVSLGSDIELRLEWSGIAAYREALLALAFTF